MKKLLTLLLLCSGTAAATGNVSLPDYEQVTLDNGAVLLLARKADVPLVGMQVMLRGGAAIDPDGQEGMADLFAQLLTKGAGGREAAAFAEAVDSVGGRIDAASGLESITISADFMSRDANLMVDLVADMLMMPKLREGELGKLRTRTIEFIRSAKDNSPQSLIGAYGAAWHFGEHPYGNPTFGSETSLSNITFDSVVDYYKNDVGADRLIISVAGDIEVDEMKALLSERFGNWRKAGSALAEKGPPPRREGRRVLLVDKPGATQTYFWLGNTGVSIAYPQRAALDLGNTIYGGRFTSMLNTALRIDTGLTYGARSRLQRLLQPGSIAISSYTRTDATVEAVDIALDVTKAFYGLAIDDELLLSAQNYVLGNFPTDYETAAQVAGEIATLRFYGLEDSYINTYADQIRGVTPDDIAAVVPDVYPSLDDLSIVFIGDAELIRDEVAKYGPVTEMKIVDPGFSPNED